MSESGASPAGWYPDTSSPGAERWWDGTRWGTETRVSAPPVAAGYVAVARPELPAGTSTSTPWIWLIAVHPIVSVVAIWFMDPSKLLPDLNTASPSSAFVDVLAVYTNPAFLALSVLGWLATVASFVFAYLDHRRLVQIGVVRPFHWAWSFLALAIGTFLVYVIGRAVIVGRVSGGRGYAPMWVAIVVYAAAMVSAIVWSIWMMSVMFAWIATLPGLTR
jgi:hypothetical protein